MTKAFFTIILGCSAPEIASTSPRLSPIEIETKKNQKPKTDTKIRLISARKGNAPNEQLTNTQDGVGKPPFTVWTLLPEVSIIGPNGSTIMKLKNSGVRLDLIEISGIYAHVLCGGCPSPQKNHAGWVKRDLVASAWNIPENVPLQKIVKLRRDWAKNINFPTEIEHKRDLCMLVDNGFRRENDTMVWEIQGGRIVLSHEESGWEIQEIKAPTTKAAPEWRCDLKFPKIEQ